MKLKLLRAKLRITTPLDEMMDVEQASDLIEAYELREGEMEAATAVAAPTRRRDPHAHLPAIGTRCDLHADVDERIFITDDHRRRQAHEVGPEEAYFSDCPGTYYVSDYIPDAPIVVARCNACGEEFGFKVPIPVAVA